MLEQHELRLDVRACTPRRAAQPRPADLDAPVLWNVGEETGRADLATVDGHRERDVARRGQSVIEPGIEISWKCHEPEDLRLGLGGHAKAFAVPFFQRFDTDDPPDERTVRSQTSLRLRGRRAHEV